MAYTVTHNSLALPLQLLKCLALYRRLFLRKPRRTFPLNSKRIILKMQTIKSIVYLSSFHRVLPFMQLYRSLATTSVLDTVLLTGLFLLHYAV